MTGSAVRYSPRVVAGEGAVARIVLLCRPEPVLLVTAAAAMLQERPLRTNPRPIACDDAERLYEAAP